MAPFVLDDTMINAKSVTQDLGDFTDIRSPAKCAARIGQAFSQTFSSIAVPEGAFVRVPDIWRNQRIFSDGVGVCSQTLLERVWDGYNQGRGHKPTVLQIRFQGMGLRGPCSKA